jgi:hypothetical protein
MGKVLLNGREPAEWELAAMERARQCELERDMQVLAGLLPTRRSRRPCMRAAR